MNDARAADLLQMAQDAGAQLTRLDVRAGGDRADSPALNGAFGTPQLTPHARRTAVRAQAETAVGDRLLP